MALEVSQANDKKVQVKRSTAMRKFGRTWKRLQSFHLDTFILGLNAQKVEFAFDSIVAQVILCNAVFVGVSLDYADRSAGWLIGELMFAMIFWLELVLKLRLHGFKQWYCGMSEDSERQGIQLANVFDTCIVLADTLQLFLLLGPDEWNDGFLSHVPISILRLVRLIRLTRVLRLLRSNVFKDLFAMIQGLSCGLSTLGWALVVFLLFIYLVALVCREVLGELEPGAERQDPDTTLYFSSVPRSMYTVFRCSFGDCSTRGGIPLFETIGTEKPHWGVLYSLFTFVVVVGLFNVISAIFVESTLASAQDLATEKLQTRLDNPDIWAVNFTKVLKALLMKQNPDMDELDGLTQGDCSDLLISQLMKAEFPKTLFDEVVREDDDVKEALSSLDISATENAHLSDILDPDNGGSIAMLELVDGLQRLRGNPRRGDIIAVDLMVRSLQVKIDFIWRCMKDCQRDLTTNRRSLSNCMYSSI